MKLAGLTFDELNAILKDNGYVVESNEYWDKHNIVILRKDNETIPITIESYYHFPFVVRYLKSLGITPPEDCQKSYDQYMAMIDKNK